MNLLILETQSEILTHTGRIDTVIHIQQYIYIFELKINKEAQQGLDQILNKKYYEAYSMYNKSIVLVGLSFNTIEEHFSITYAIKDL